MTESHFQSRLEQQGWPRFETQVGETMLPPRCLEMAVLVIETQSKMV